MKITPGMRTLLLGLCVCGAAMGPAHAADFPFGGRWKIDAPKSSWSDGKFPKNMSITIDLVFQNDQLLYHSINDTNKDKPALLDWTAKLDWQPYPIANNARFNEVRVRRLTPTQLEVLELKDGDVIVNALWEMLDGGRRFVRRGIGKGADGKSHEYEEFFDKQ
jgi:hypothetical protein